MARHEIQIYLKTLPASPGIYLFKDADGEIIYVGKAADLRSRVRSYFRKDAASSEKLQQLVPKIDRIEFVVTESELAALVLECQQIKKYSPKYNVLLKDDKSFPYIKIDVASEWPKMSITRQRYHDGAIYIGRIPSAASARQTYEYIKKVFPLRSCNKKISGTEKRPCLNYHIQRCLAPCIGAISREDYSRLVKQAVALLQGKEESLLRELKGEMAKASHNLEYEKAAQLRDRVQAINDVIQSHKITLNVRGEKDIVAIASDKNVACVRIFSIMDGKLTGDQHFIMQNTRDEDNSRIMESFLTQYYSAASYIPDTVLVQYPAKDHNLIAAWLRDKRGSGVEIRVPTRGAGLRLVNMVAENARQELSMYLARRAAHPDNLQLLNNLKQALNLPAVPDRIEAYDISNIQGNVAVGSMVVFERGMPKPAHYRRFKIRTVEGTDDYAMMREMIQRRFRGFLEAKGTWAAAPDLVLIDGGKGHLSAALKALKEISINSLPVASLAKENEEVFMAGKKGPLDIARESEESLLLQRVRDEAHRFAVTYHRKLRSKEGRASALDTIPGVGTKRKKALIARFGSVKNIKSSTAEELASVSGINIELAGKILESLT
ncbi:MAG: excinuclease ABC subunit UvrC [Dehalococcoidia bacterium]|nr:excinuclease ABC subunit UvrC [Dehalococcoidia bacterium]MDD5494995.1 excinuclease ABC subunit UvrC [Dehalococcoidia bacterium]